VFVVKLDEDFYLVLRLITDDAIAVDTELHIGRKFRARTGNFADRVCVEDK
jgi:hypothetical protein